VKSWDFAFAVFLAYCIEQSAQVLAMMVERKKYAQVSNLCHRNLW
jgi:hypothetical protein